MGDVNDGEAVCLQGADKLKQSLDLFFFQRGSGLVQNEHFGVFGYCLDDLHDLALSAGQRGDKVGRADIHVEPVQKLLGFPVELFFVYQVRPMDRIVSDEYVVGHGHIQGKRQLLEYDGDAACIGALDGVQGHLLIFNLDRAGVFGINACQDLHQRAFSGAVLPDKAQDFAISQIEIHMVQHGVPIK